MSKLSLPTPVIRIATADDSREIARLLTLLGHPTSEADIVQKWAEWSAAGNSALVAASSNQTLFGVATLHIMTVLHRPRPVGRITALVVDEPARRRGIGRALVDAAEAIFSNAGCGLLEVTSNDRLVEAHAFYERLGFARTSARLAKSLTAR